MLYQAGDGRREDEPRRRSPQIIPSTQPLGVIVVAGEELSAAGRACGPPWTRIEQEGRGAARRAPTRFPPPIPKGSGRSFIGSSVVGRRAHHTTVCAGGVLCLRVAVRVGPARRAQRVDVSMRLYQPSSRSSTRTCRPPAVTRRVLHAAEQPHHRDTSGPARAGEKRGTRGRPATRVDPAREHCRTSTPREFASAWATRPRQQTARAPTRDAPERPRRR